MLKKTITFLSLLVLTTLVNADDDAKPLELISQNHDLIDKIWSIKDNKFIDKDTLLEKAYEGDYVLLGETHDNIKHHEDHGWFIKKIAEKSQQAAIAFEMLSKDQAKVINNVEFESADELLEILEQAKTGWEYKKYYKPVFESAFKAKLPMHATEVNRKTLMEIVTKGIETAPKEIQDMLKENKLSAEEKESLEKEIEMTHCGMINAEMTKAMMLGQQVRDAAIGHALYEMRKDPVKTGILVAGSGHIRKDRGAPAYLKSLDKNANIVAIAWLEIEPEVNDPKDYSKRWGSEGLPFDYAVFTAQVDRPDPCEEMKKYMQKKHGKKS